MIKKKNTFKVLARFFVVAALAVSSIVPANVFAQEGGSINLEKTANPSTLPAEGGSVTYTFTVTNPHSAVLSDVVLVDNQCSPISGPTGDSNNDGKLQHSETWTYSCTKNLTQTTTNTATVNATWDGGLTVSDTDSATVTVSASQPDIHLEKTANPSTLPASGGSVTYSMVVTNPGNTTLSGVSLVDNQCAPISGPTGDSNNNSMLESSETWTYTCTRNLTQSTTNTATVNAMSGQSPVSDSDSAHVSVGTADPMIHVEKSANPSSLPAEGGAVAYSFAVTNPGNVALSNVVIADNKCAPISGPTGDIDNDGKLDVGETWMYSCTHNISQSTTNTVTVTANNGEDVITDSDTITVPVGFVSNPQIHLEKSASDSNLPVGGGSVTYTMTVTNTGNQTLNNIQISDPECSPISSASGDANNNQMLEVSETWTYTCTKNVSQTDTNTASVSGAFNGQTYTDTDSATVTVAEDVGNESEISIAKSASATNLPFGGGNVTYTMTITNPGDNALSNVQISDPSCSPLSSVSGDANDNDILEVSETWTVTCSRNVNATHTNTASVSGVFNNQTFTDTASVTVNVATQNPNINLVKSASSTNLAAGGGNVTYTLTLTNPGSNSLSNIQFSDPSCSPLSSVSGDANDNDILEVSETWTVTCSRNVDATHTNTASVSGVFNGETFTDTSSVTVNVAAPSAPAINLTKSAGQSNLAAGGGNVTFTLTATNAGGFPLSNVEISDSSCGTITRQSGDANSNNILEASETWVYTCSLNVTNSMTNVASISAVGNNVNVTDTATASVTVAPTVQTVTNTNTVFTPVPVPTPVPTPAPTPTPTGQVFITNPSFTPVPVSVSTPVLSSPFTTSPSTFSAQTPVASTFLPDTGVGPDEDESVASPIFLAALLAAVSGLAVLAFRKKLA